MSPDADQDLFVEDPKAQWPLTDRTRFILWRAVHSFMCDIDGDISQMRESGCKTSADLDPDMIAAISAFPRVTHRQSLAWWQKVYAASERLVEGLRVGGEAMVPLTIAEEAILAIVTNRPNVPGHAEVVMNDDETYAPILAQFEALEIQVDDFDSPGFDWREILPELKGDIDVLALWEPLLDGMDDPDSDLNQRIGMGDYRPMNWHALLRSTEEI